MDNYLTFDEAVIFLKTNTSTLYKWLQSGKIPAHKLGRQWRFVREELEAYLSGNGQNKEMQQEIILLAQFLSSRGNPKVVVGETSDVQLLQNIIRDAVHHKAHSIHFYMADGRYEIAYRIDGLMQKVSSIHEDLFAQIHQKLVEHSFPLQDENARGAYLQKDKDDASTQTQIHYQKIDTLNGIRVTLKIIPNDLKLVTIAQLARDNTVRETFFKWLKPRTGLVIVSGTVGNGMTTTTCSFLNYLKDQGKNVFLIQDSSEIVYPQISRVETKADDPEDFSRVLNQVMASDADSIGFTLSPASDLEPALFKAAYRAISKGHLVVMQFNAPSCEAVIEKIKKHAPDILDSQIKIGISHQTLVPKPEGGVIAEYKLLELNQEA